MDTLKASRCNLPEIKKILIKHCSLIKERDLFVYGPEIKELGGNYKFLVLDGTPPKGYGIYSHSSENSMLCLYDDRGKRFKEYYLEKEIDFNQE